MKWQIVCDDILKWCKTSDYMAHAILCDPPYHLTGGFMGAYWDRDGPDAISFQAKTWAALAEHLLPGGFLFVFASSRGWHRLACALEDAGLIIQPSIFNWRTREVVEVPFCMIHLQGQSFPKSTRIDTAIDKAAGVEREVIDRIPHTSGLERNDSVVATRTGGGGTRRGLFAKELMDITAPATDLARAWEGHRYGGQILKDAAGPIVIAMRPPDTELCPIIVAQKRWEGKRLDCIVETGAGALNIDGARIGMQNRDSIDWCDCDHEAQS